MPVIHKFPLKIDDVQVLKLQGEYQILHVGERNGTLTLWAWHEPGGEENLLTIRVLGTRQQFTEGDEYWMHLGTVQMSDSFVWHVFSVEDIN